ncbi:MAG: DUF5688 family protein [Lentihominibacter sp.]
MNYNLFKEVMVERIMDFLPPVFRGCEPVVEKITKVNREMDALTIRPTNGSKGIALPIVYLDEMYDIFTVNEDLDSVLAFAAGIILNFTGALEPKNCEITPENIKKNVIPNLINTKRNEKLLESIPHRNYLDISIIYRVMVESEDEGFDTLVVTDSLLEMAEMDLDELHETAVKNMYEKFPVRADSLMKGSTGVPEIFSKNFVVVSNEQELFGSTYMLCSDVLNRIADEFGVTDLYIVPLSIDEFCVVEAREEYLEPLVEVLYNKNCSCEDSRSYLTDSVYFYQKGTSEMHVAATGGVETSSVN